MTTSSDLAKRENRELPEEDGAVKEQKSWEEQREILKQALRDSSRDLCQAGISVFEVDYDQDGELCCELNAWDWFDEVFGTAFFALDTKCHVNVFASYDLQGGEVRDELCVVLWDDDDDQSEGFSRTLSSEERESLLQIMEAYLPRHTGLTLQEYAEDYREQQHDRQESQGMGGPVFG